MVSRTRVNRPKCSRRMSTILPLAVIFVILTSLPRCLSSHSTSHAHPKTLLTLKPPRADTRGDWLRQPLQSPTDILPEFVGTLKFDTKLEWAAPCFRDSVAYLNRTEPKEGGDEQDLGGMVLNLDLNSPSAFLCTDLYVFGTPFQLTGDYFFFHGHHSFNLPWLDPKEKAYVSEKGLSVFLLPKGFLGTLHGLWDVLPLLSNSWVGEAAQIAFLERKMGAKFVKRTGQTESDMSESNTLYLDTGDLLVQSKVRGPWGAFETLEKWASGSWAGHTAVCMRDEMGELHVAESGHYNDEGEPIIVIMPFPAWWAYNLKDAGQPHLAVLKLHSRLRAGFNSSAAWEFVRGMAGKPFGAHNIVFSWIDTPDQNFPPPINSQLVASLASMWIRVQPVYAGNLLKEALNKRLHTQDLEFPEVLEECAKREISFGELLSVPEKDDWVYSDGISTSCVAFVMSTWKAAGVFGNLTDSIQGTEFTIRDAYNLKIFEDDPKKMPPWCELSAEDPSATFCQILGKWRFDLPGFNTQEPYAHMNEKCPSMPPKYERPSDC